MSLIAREGGGKTSFLMTLPKPLAIVALDPNTEMIIEKAAEAGHVDTDSLLMHYCKMPAIAFNDKDDTKDEAQATWDGIVDFLRPFITADEEDRPKAVAFDTATELDTLNVQAQFGKNDQISPEQRRNQMGPVNSRYKGIIRALTDVGIHVVLAHRAGDLWASETVRTRNGPEEQRNKVEGIFASERKGFKETGFITSTEVILAHDPDRHEKLVGQFGMKIVRCSLRPGLKGQEYWGREKQPDGSRLAKASFPFLMSRVYSNTAPDDWS